MRLHLGALPPERAGDLLDTLLGTHEELLPLKRLLVERAGGNPFFLEESVHDLVQGGALVGEPGAYRLAHSAPTIHVPSTVRSMVEARIDRLPFEDKRVLQCAAVIGEQVPRGLLEAVTDLGADELQAALARLRRAEFLEEQTLFPSPRTGSGTRSPTTWRTAACSTTAVARCTGGCSPRSRRTTATTSTRSPAPSPITRRTRNGGRRRRTTRGGRGWRARPT